MACYFKINDFSIRLIYKVKVSMISKLTKYSKHYTPIIILIPPADEMAKILIYISFFFYADLGRSEQFPKIQLWAALLSGGGILLLLARRCAY